MHGWRNVADGHTKKGCVVFADAARRARGSAVAGIKAEGQGLTATPFDSAEIFSHSVGTVLGVSGYGIEYTYPLSEETHRVVSLFCIASSARLPIPEIVTVTDGVVAPGGNTSIRSAADSTTMMFPARSTSNP